MSQHTAARTLKSRKSASSCSPASTSASCCTAAAASWSAPAEGSRALWEHEGVRAGGHSCGAQVGEHAASRPGQQAGAAERTPSPLTVHQAAQRGPVDVLLGGRAGSAVNVHQGGAEGLCRGTHLAQRGLPQHVQLHGRAAGGAVAGLGLGSVDPSLGSQCGRAGAQGQPGQCRRRAAVLRAGGAQKRLWPGGSAVRAAHSAIAPAHLDSLALQVRQLLQGSQIGPCSPQHAVGAGALQEGQHPVGAWLMGLRLRHGCFGRAGSAPGCPSAPSRAPPAAPLGLIASRRAQLMPSQCRDADDRVSGRLASL